MTKEGQPGDADLEPQRSLWSCHNFTAASPVGALVLPDAKSEIVDLGTSRCSAISTKVIPIGSARKSSMRDFQVSMGQSIRDPVREMQRHPVTGFRHPSVMQPPKDYPGLGSHLGQRLIFWRNQRGMSRQALADATGIAVTTLSTIENQDQHSSTKITKLAHALGVSADYLATGEGNPYQFVQQVPARKDWPEEFPSLDILKPLEPNERILAGKMLEEAVQKIKERRTKRSRKEG